jgi:fibronectin type 3 domain-containing protein
LRLQAIVNFVHSGHAVFNSPAQSHVQARTSGRSRAKACAFASLVALVVLGGGAGAAPSPQLTRYPYLTDSIQTSVTVNWGTAATGTAGSVRWGPPGACAQNSTAGTRTTISVNGVSEYQWKATVPVTPDTTYCYRVMLDSTDLLGSDASPTFTSQVAAGSSAPFSFAVFGDWGQAYANSANADQANVLAQIAASGARFAVMTGDTAYPNGDQKNYGDLQQVGTDVSAIFAPAFWGVPGRSVPVFNVTGNHGFTNGNFQVVNWPEANAAASSGGRYLMESYPSINGSTPRSYPSMWYAFDAGKARFYILTAAWADGNVGTGSVYANDAAAHWTPSSAEYQWLANDLATHPRSLKFAFWHYPLYADSSGQPSDTSLQGGPGTLQGLLDENNVNIAFNGHAHGYERNLPDPAGLVSYILGNGGAALGSVSGCSSFDAYAIGRSGSHCGGAPAGLTDDYVFGFAKVTVNGQQVTVTPTDEMGRTYDVQTYTFPSSEPDSTPPTVPGGLTATSPARGEVDLSWTASTDNVGVTGYHIYREPPFNSDHAPVTLSGTGTTYADLSAAPATAYAYTVTALDAAGNESAKQTTPTTVTTMGPADTQTPSAPRNLTASAPASSTVNLSWTRSTDDVRVIGYYVYRNDVLLKSLPDDATTFQDETASPGTGYTYQVSAFDAAGNESAKAAVNVTTPASGGGPVTLVFAPTDDATIDASTPDSALGTSNRITVDTSPANDFLVKFTVSGTGAGTSCPTIASAKLRLTVGGTTNDNSPKGGDFRGAVSSSWSESSVTWNNAPAAAAGGPVASITTAVALNTTYFVDVTPLVTGNGDVTIRASGNSSDGARYYSRNGNTSAQAPELDVTCAAATPDTQPPTKPGTPTLNAVTSSTVTMSWAASTDNVGVTGYRIFRDGVKVGETGGSVTTYQDTGLAAGTTYGYTLKAVDAAGNASAESGQLNATTSGTGDITPPSTPGTPKVTGVGSSSFHLVWSASTDDVGVARYEVWRNGTLLGPSQPAGATTFDDTGVLPGTYTYSVKAFDAAGNSSVSAATTPPATPSAPNVSGVTTSTVTLTWPAGPAGVTSYAIYRDGGATPLATVATTSYQDSGLAAGTTYRYALQAIDGNGNSSLLSGTTSATTTASGPTTLSFAPTDDATIDATKPTTNFGTNTRVVVDTSPVNGFLLRFAVSGIGSPGCTTVTRATLRLTVGTNSDDGSPKGGVFFLAAGSTWSESNVTWNTAPATVGQALASITTTVSLGGTYTVDITPAITANGPITIRVTGNSSDGARYDSKDGNPSNVAPELDVTCT